SLSGGASSSCASAGISSRSSPSCRCRGSSSPGRSPASPGCCSSANRSRRAGACCAHDRRRVRPGTGGDPALRRVLRALHPAGAGRIRARPRLPADRDSGGAALADDALQRDLQGIQLVHPPRGAVLPADCEPDERRRHHRSAGAASASPVRPFSPAAGAQHTVLFCVFGAGIAGSSPGDAASQSKIFIEAQVKEGYGLSFSIAITAVSAVLAVIIPPSILMIVWGGVISTSIGAMYLAGFLPGLLIAGAQMVTVHVYSKIYNYPVYPRSTFKEFFYSLWISLPALTTAFIIVGGVLLGWFTPTESAAVAVLYTVALSFFVYREMDLTRFYDALAETGRLSAVALFCVGTASA